ncbi:MAG: hypothetical protein KF878_02410 [Planctomycetes bacterium]|nr:hypothetical protein [Planctomycetota bacterium]
MEKDVAKAPREAAVSVHRCPFCRDDVGRTDSVVCADCLTRHHGGCWSEGGDRCGSCQGPRKLAPEPLTLSVAVRLLEEQGYGADEVRALLAAPPREAPPTAGDGSVFVRRVVVPLSLLMGPPLLTTTFVAVLLTEIGASSNNVLRMTAVSFPIAAVAGLLAMFLALRRS